MFVKPKKSFGQHFLTSPQIAERIVNALDCSPGETVLEIGPGKGALSALLDKREINLALFELDRESAAYLKATYPDAKWKMTTGDCLELDWNELGNSFKVIGNFPYNISSQILFKVLAHRRQVTEVVGMLQKEAAQRIAEGPGSKVYGILSVLLQTWYDVKLLFTVSPGVFFPPPKVKSAAIKLTRNKRQELPCCEKLYRQVVKQAFQNRRKTLRNALKPLNLRPSLTTLPIFDKRAEQLSAEQFIELTQQIEWSRSSLS
ncbi:MAG: ribosomal RNA small subunit methyltransferase A [Candidatus Nephrothrix sp. EaCA]|nr:MAG: ribosomal RNA small subunit methyltransferase A [Candidatus Nephrothrix sp. EaCA]